METINLPIASHHNSVDSFYQWLKKKVEVTEYGEVGITFVIHSGDIVRVKEHIEISCKSAKE